MIPRYFTLTIAVRFSIRVLDIICNGQDSPVKATLTVLHHYVIPYTVCAMKYVFGLLASFSRGYFIISTGSMRYIYTYHEGLLDRNWDNRMGNHMIALVPGILGDKDKIIRYITTIKHRNTQAACIFKGFRVKWQCSAPFVVVKSTICKFVMRKHK